MWVKTLRHCFHPGSLDFCAFGTVRRTTWDGSQELDEIQQPAYDSATIAHEENDITIDTAAVNALTNYVDVNAFFGRVLYTHGLTVDQPLSMLRVNYVDTTTAAGARWQIWPAFTIVPQWDYRGQPVAGFFTVPSPAHQLDRHPLHRFVALCVH